MKKVVVIVLILVVVVLAAFRLKHVHSKINSKNKNSGISSLVTVNVDKVKKMNADRTLNLVGVLNANTEINIAAEAQGKITYLNAELGQSKSKGAVIGTIDNKLKSLAVETAKNTESKLRRDLERYENLLKGGSATQQQVDDARNAYENAKIQLESAQKQLADATITSPINGIIIQRQVEQGAFVNVGTVVASIVDVSKFRIKINVSEANIYKLKVGDRAKITTDVYSGVSFDGRISFISSKGDETHNYQVEILINNNSKNPLRAGTFVNAQIDIPNKKSGLFIPRESLQGSYQDARVYVVEDGKAVLKNITVSSGNDKYIEVISGLKEGETVVVTGQINLTTGQGVKIIENKD